MPSWGEIGAEIAKIGSAANPGTNPLDIVRRKYLATVHAHTKRAVIVYATRWTMSPNGLNINPALLSITANDIHAFMEALHGISENKLDLIIHSPGGSPEAAEAIVKYLRSKFEHIRVFVPHMAMSAATMISCAADQIVMGRHSFIGPIDPQFSLQTGLGPRFVPAQAIVDQFAKATAECQDPNKIRAWLPMLTQYGPDLLVACENATKLSKNLVSNWLENYMFKDEQTAANKAQSIADWMADHNEFKAHGRPISREMARDKGMNIVDLEDDQFLQDAVLSVYHATSHTFGHSIVAKIVENHLGKAYMENLSVQQVFPGIAMPFPGGKPATLS